MRQYYDDTYDDNLVHKFSKMPIKIVQACYADSIGMVSKLCNSNCIYISLPNIKFEVKSDESHGKEFYYVPDSSVDKVMCQCEFKTRIIANRVCIVTAKLPTGFIITEYATSVSSHNNSKEKGEEICKEKIKNRLRDYLTLLMSAFIMQK